MDHELKVLLERAEKAELTQEQIAEQRLHLAAANGFLADSRIDVDTVRATRTIMLKSEEQKTEKV